MQRTPKVVPDISLGAKGPLIGPNGTIRTLETNRTDSHHNREGTVTTIDLKTVLRQMAHYQGFFCGAFFRESSSDAYILIRVQVYLVPKMLQWNPWKEPINYVYPTWRFVHQPIAVETLAGIVDAIGTGSLVSISEDLQARLPLTLKHDGRQARRRGARQANRVLRLPTPADEYILWSGEERSGDLDASLLAGACPYFPNVFEAMARLVDQIDEPALGEDYGVPRITVRVCDDRAHVKRVSMRPNEVEVTIVGTVHEGMELKMYVRGGAWKSVPLDPDQRSYSFPWTEIPDYAEWITAPDTTLVDRQVFSRIPGSYTNPVVSIDYGFDETIDRYLAAGESNTVEFKEKLPHDHSTKEFLETISAFANATGGTLFVGIGDHGDVHGVTKDDKWKDRLMNTIHNRMDPAPPVHCSQVTYMENTILYVIEVPAGNNPPYTVTVGSPSTYIRHGANDFVATRSELDALYTRHRAQPLPNYPLLGQ